jgi:phospholipid N-methyltransferase
MWTFYKALFKNPRSVGSVIPSSKYLARKIAGFIPLEAEGFVIELGPGTGAITRAILRQGVAHHQLIAIESSADLVAALHERFPQIQIIHGNADQLSSLLAKIHGPIKAIVSSIPLLLSEANERENILTEIEKVLEPGGYYIQYTYGFKKSAIELKQHFKKIYSTRVWLNLPPARVDVFQIITKKN